MACKLNTDVNEILTCEDIKMKDENDRIEETSDAGQYDIIANEKQELSILITDEDKTEGIFLK